MTVATEIRTVVVTASDLNGNPAKLLKMKDLKPTDIDYHMVHSRIRRRIQPFISEGYSVVLIHDDKQYLLIYNK